MHFRKSNPPHNSNLFSITICFFSSKNSTFSNTIREFKHSRDTSLKICALGTFTNTTIKQLFRGFLKSYFFDGLIRKHLYLVKRTSVKIEWLTELWSHSLILLWDLCWMWKSFHWNDTMGERELRGGWKLKEFRKTKQLQSCMAVEEEMVEEGA